MNPDRLWDAEIKNLWLATATFMTAYRCRALLTSVMHRGLPVDLFAVIQRTVSLSFINAMEFDSLHFSVSATNLVTTTSLQTYSEVQYWHSAPHLTFPPFIYWQSYFTINPKCLCHLSEKVYCWCSFFFKLIISIFSNGSSCRVVWTFWKARGKWLMEDSDLNSVNLSWIPAAAPCSALARGREGGNGWEVFQASGNHF